MRDDLRMPQTPRAAPVADLPIDSLLTRAEEIARRWAISLVLARPLDGLSEVPLEDLAQEAPAVCAQLTRALESEAELDRLAPRTPSAGHDEAPVRRLAAMSGARDAAALVDAIEDLRGAVWETLLEELRWPTFDHAYAHRVADLSDRLAYVCATALASALDAASAVALEERSSPPAPPSPIAAQPSAGRPTQGGEGRVVIVDEREQAASPRRRAPAEIEIRDERAEAGPAAWIGSIGRQLERYRRDGRSFAVLLLELGDVERLRAEVSPAQVSRLTGEVERLLTSELRAGEAVAAAGAGRSGEAGAPRSLTRERPGRYWLLARDIDRTGAAALAERVTGAVRRLARQHGAVLEIAIGTAVCPEDGREAAALAAHADLELYAARAAARTAPGRP